VTTDEPATPEDDGTVGHAIFLLELGGTWTTDCGCKTVVDVTRYRMDWQDKPMHPAPQGRFVIAYDYEQRGVFHHTVHRGSHDPTAAVVEALDHECGDEYRPVVTVPVD
jgi:hypothetical protein